ncbi:MAG: hypothetical protein V4662_12205 [Verrucomicrobiota bacterium]
MNDFDSRWQSAAQAARGAPDEVCAELPFGFATRVLARFENTPAEPWVDLLTALGLRAVLTSAVLFIASAALVAWQMDFITLAPTLIESPISPSLFLP